MSGGMKRGDAVGGYEVGYGRPPVHTRFRKGESGNPGGRPRGRSERGAKALALEEAYRLVTVKEGKTSVALPAIQAIWRSQVTAAVKGSIAAQRTVMAAVLAIEEEEHEEERRNGDAGLEEMSDIEAARRIAFLLNLAEREEDAQHLEPPSGGLLATGPE